MTTAHEANESESCFAMYKGTQLVGWRTNRVVVDDGRYVCASETWYRYFFAQGGPETQMRSRFDFVLDPSLSLVSMVWTEQGVRNGELVDVSYTTERVGDELVVRKTVSGSTTEARLGPPDSTSPVLPAGFERLFPRVLLAMGPGQPYTVRVIQGESVVKANLRRGPAGPQRIRDQTRQGVEILISGMRIVCDEAGQVLAHETHPTTGSFYPMAMEELARTFGSNGPQRLTPRAPQRTDNRSGRAGRDQAQRAGPLSRTQVDDDFYKERLLGVLGTNGTLLGYRLVRVASGRADGRRLYGVAMGRFDWVRRSGQVTEAYYRIDAQLDPSFRVVASRVAVRGKIAGQPIDQSVTLEGREADLLRATYEGTRKVEESPVEAPDALVPHGVELMFPRLLLDLEVSRPTELAQLDLGSGNVIRATFTRRPPATRAFRGGEREAVEVATSRAVDGQLRQAQIFLDPRSGEILEIVGEDRSRIVPIDPSELSGFPRYAQPVRLETCDPERGGPVLVDPTAPATASGRSEQEADEPLGEGGSPADVVARLFAAVARRERVVMERCMNLKEMNLRTITNRREREAFEQVWARDSRRLIDAQIEDMIRRSGPADQLPPWPTDFAKAADSSSR